MESVNIYASVKFIRGALSGMEFERFKLYPMPDVQAAQMEVSRIQADIEQGRMPPVHAHYQINKVWMEI